MMSSINPGQRTENAAMPELLQSSACLPDCLLLSEAPRGKPRGIFAEPCEARNAILSSIVRRGGTTEDPPCGKPQGFLAKKGDLK